MVTGYKETCEKGVPTIFSPVTHFSSLISDILYSSFISDTLYSYLISDTLYSSLISDTLYSSLISDTLYGSLIFDTLYSSLISDTLQVTNPKHTTGPLSQIHYRFLIPNTLQRPHNTIHPLNIANIHNINLIPTTPFNIF